MIILFTFITYSYSRCAFSVECQGNNCDPLEVDTEPFVARVSQCPHMDGTMVCCNKNQDDQMQRNFQAIDASFGNAGGGCDICAYNLKKFWCEYTCSPNQSQFLTTNGYTNMKDPLNPKNILKVQLVEIKVKPQVACDMWSSCKRTQFASQVTAMKTPGGFFNFQGEQAVGQAKQFISVKFVDNDEETINFDFVPDCKYEYPPGPDGKIVTPDGFVISERCSCNNCDLMCHDEEILYKETGVFEGFNGYLVLWVWAGAILIAALITGFRYYKQKANHEILIDPI
ncbi:unnamed protein product [Paramecium pentaurelia]|uniref:Niemann-Pick C1 N-terminal domain-containing protein n=1 Tax=Paramecium pentaurelia TaxID=43138 RepID=A0A8S1TPQ2_9CILI|nr:unnamed protein product [Paramecium pentaurelia]